MLKCADCGKDRILIYGRCAECAPAVFEIHEQWNEFIEQASAAYRREHGGNDPLKNWTDFEAFLFERYKAELKRLIAEHERVDSEMKGR